MTLEVLASMMEQLEFGDWELENDSWDKRMKW